MDLGAWLAFVGMTTVLLVIPGPTILLVVSYAIGQGFRAAWPMALGVALGDLTAMTVSMLGLGALLATSATLFTALRWIGAAYLIFLGVKLWRAAGTLDAPPRRDPIARLRMVAHAWLVTALNPKSITFFVAFVPQFLDVSKDLLAQIIVLESTFVLLAFANAFGYALAASRARGLFSSAATLRGLNRAGGAVLMMAGGATALVRPATS